MRPCQIRHGLREPPENKLPDLFTRRHGGRKTEDGRRRMENGEWRMENGEWREAYWSIIFCCLPERGTSVKWRESTLSRQRGGGGGATALPTIPAGDGTRDAMELIPWVIEYRSPTRRLPGLCAGPPDHPGPPECPNRRAARQSPRTKARCHPGAGVNTIP